MATEGSERPAKRARKDAHAVAEERTTHDDTALEVDILILDYAVYESIAACLASRDPSTDTPVSLAHSLAMTKDFVAIFKARHPTYTDLELRFRMRLLQFAILFTQRLTRNPATPARADTQHLRANNLDRARRWIGTAERVPSAAYTTEPFDTPSSFPTTEKLEHNRAYVLYELDIPAEDEAYEDSFYGTVSCVSLLDLLPMFMQVSAARSAHNSATEDWMQLACEFMLQACLEQYLVCGAQGSDAVNEAFAWGYRDSAGTEGRESGEEVDNKREGGDDEEVNDMFEDPVYESEIDGWRQVREHYIAWLFPPAKSSKDTYSVPTPSDDAGDSDRPPVATDLVSQLEMAAAEHPIATFENTMLKFLSELSQSVTRPILVQLEAGALDGMSKEETSEFVRSCGLSTAEFCKGPVGVQSCSGEMN
ncbi:hypothetical protein LTR08_000987 [Meristemomyces frigidus]|nr:hypothetical protein LTR08_000987 [Meristemomyces frigidus]